MQRTTHQSQSTYNTLTVLFDEDGFLTSPEPWSRELSQVIAHMYDLGPMNNDHWKVIEFLRDHYTEFEFLPAMRRVCRVCGLKKHAVQGLFGGCMNAWRIAGLPNPGPEALAYMD